MQAWCGFIFQTTQARRITPDTGFDFGATATLRGHSAAAPPVSGGPLPEPGTFLVISPAAQFSAGNTHWLPAQQGGWGVGHLGISSSYGTVLSAERGKSAPVGEEEDAHGILQKATIGSDRQSFQIRTIIRAATTVEPGDAITVAGAVFYITDVQEIWAAGEWAEMALQCRRWPGLPRVRTFGPMTS